METHRAWSVDLVTKINSPTDAERDRLQPSSTLAAVLAPATSPELLTLLILECCP